ncbi:hypothetical protein NE236_10170 [Actinoallomurus purpureus]|nr:hypothetical protein [Actinoallomurus purpureus]
MLRTHRGPQGAGRGHIATTPDRTSPGKPHDFLLHETNTQLRQLGRTGQDIDGKDVQNALGELERAGRRPPGNPRGRAQWVAHHIAGKPLPVLPGGAIGFEAELLPRVTLRPGITGDDFQIIAKDGTFEVVLDNNGAYKAKDGTFYKSEDNLLGAGKEVAEWTHWPILEIVTAPIAVLPGEERARRSAGAVFAAVESALSRMRHSPQGTPIEEIFPKDRFTYTHDAEDALLIPDPTIDGIRPELYMHYTVGMPLESGVSFLEHVRDNEWHPIRKRRLSDGIRFSGEMISLYHGTRYAPPTADLLDERDVSMLRFFLATVYTQVAAAFPGGSQDPEMIKNRTSVALRTNLAAWRAALPQPVQDFLRDRAAEIRAELLRTAGVERPGLTSDALKVRLDDESNATIGDYLDNALLPDPGHIVDQYQALGVRTRFANLDTAQRGLRTPLVLLELRSSHRRARTLNDVKATFTDLKQLATQSYESARTMRDAEHNDPRRTEHRRRLARELSTSTNPAVRDTLRALEVVDDNAAPILTASEVQAILAELGAYLHDPAANAESLAKALRKVADGIGPVHPVPDTYGPVEETQRILWGVSGWLRHRNDPDLLKFVNGILRTDRTLGWTGDNVDANAVHEAGRKVLVQNTPLPKNRAEWANAIAQQIARGNAPPRMRGGRPTFRKDWQTPTHEVNPAGSSRSPYPLTDSHVVTADLATSGIVPPQHGAGTPTEHTAGSGPGVHDSFVTDDNGLRWKFSSLSDGQLCVEVAEVCRKFT